MRAIQSAVIEQITKTIEMLLSQHQNSRLRFVSLNYENDFSVAEG